MVSQCCQCQRIRQGDRWVAPQESLSSDEPVSHSYCPHCATEFQREIKTDRFNSNRAFAPASIDSGLQGVGQQ